MKSCTLLVALLLCTALCSVTCARFPAGPQKRSLSYDTLSASEFVASMRDTKRSIHSGNVFAVSGIRHAKRGQDEVALKLKRKMSNPNVYVDGVLVEDHPSVSVFTGHVLGDEESIVAVSLRKGEVYGMVHWADGDHHVLKYKDTLALEHLEANEDPGQAHTPACHTSTHHHGPTINETRFGGKKAVEDNGLNSWNGKTYELKVAIEADFNFVQLFGGSTTDATNYLEMVIGVVSGMYDRDFHATLDIVQIGLNSFYAGSGSSMKSHYESTYPSLDFNLGGAFSGGRGGGYAMTVGGLCSSSRFCDAGLSATYGTSEFDAIHDPYIIAHEFGHLVGSHHTHDYDYYNPVIDSCGNGGSVPPDAGSIMSYCVTRNSPLNQSPCWSYCQLALVMGQVGAHGYQSERVNQYIRTHLEDSETCANLATVGSTPAPPPPPTNAPVPGSTPPPPPGQIHLFNQFDNCVVYDFPAQYSPDNGAVANAADDFVVPSGETWHLSEVKISGRTQPSGSSLSFDSISVLVYDDDSGIPGQVVCNDMNSQIISSNSNGDMTLSMPGNDCDLTPGRYWFQVLPVRDFSPDSFQYFWKESSASFGYPFHWKEPEDIFHSKINPCLDWSVADECYYVAEPDLCFSLYGTVVVPTAAPTDAPTDVATNAPTDAPTDGTTPPGVSGNAPGIIDASQFIGFYDLSLGIQGSSTVDLCGKEGFIQQNEATTALPDVYKKKNGYCKIGAIQGGEYLDYVIDVQSVGNYDLTMSFASNANKNMDVIVITDNLANTEILNLYGTGGGSVYQTESVSIGSLTAGLHTIRLMFTTNGFNFRYIELS